MLRKAPSIRHLLLFAFLLAVLLPNVLITGLAFYEARSTLKDAIQNGMQTQVSATALEIDRMMFERLQNISSWSTLDVMQDARIGDIDKRLSSFLTELKGSYLDIYIELYVINRQNIIIASSNPAQLGKFAPRLQPWLHTLMQHKVVKLGQINNSQLPIYTDINDAFDDDKPLGTLVAVFNWNQIHQILRSGISGRSAAALFAQDNIISSTERWAKTQAAHKLMATAPTSGYEGYRGFNWQVKIAQNRSQALTPVRQMAYIFAGLLVVTVLLATVIAIPVARAISQPVARLTEFATRFLRNPSATLPPAGGPEEIAEMSRAFAKMMEDLDNSKQSLTRAAKLAVAGEMAAAMSHEVRTPLGILRSSAQLLLREPNLSAESQEICGFIVKETERLNKLVNTLVDSAKPRPPELSPCNITELVTMCAGMLRSQASKKGIAIEIVDNPPIVCDCDIEQMTQVILNLLLNAVQILPEQGHINIQLEETADHVRILVADDGPGVAPEHREQIFDPFYSQRNGGIGLGLAIVRQIILAHHGTIHVQPGPNHGAEFVIQIPRNGV
ncbi:sensor histidine kinase [Methylobacillus sp.]|uniref:sensor histidine kinase n=1 Tax=Methylobacillus sp. TaxID=56818 RepID=UPI002FE2A957